MLEDITILVVDDDVTNRLVLRALLKESGFKTLEAENGKVAVAVVEEHHVDIILMDIMMPVMDGYEAARIIKTNHDVFIPIIFLTAMTDEAALAECIKVGGDDFLTKPVDFAMLKEKLNLNS